MNITLDWLGVATFRLTIGDLVVFLDGYMDRVPAAPPVGMRTADVERADFVLVGHSHFDHLWGVERIALQTGATVIGSHETVRVMLEQGVPESQLFHVAGGEPYRLADDVLVRVYPMLHSCVWSRGLAVGPTEECLGDLGLTHQERQARLGRLFADRAGEPGMDEVGRHFLESNQHPRDNGGAYAYLIETAEGSVLWKDTSGHWSSLLGTIRPDVALLAAAGRANVDGEPIQGSLADFVASEVALLQPGQVALCHHDNWMPPVTRGLDVAPVRERLARDAPDVGFIEMGYLEGRPLFTP